MTAFRGALAAEWIKLWSVRSTWLTLAFALVSGVAVGLVDTVTTARSWDTLPPADRASFDAVGSAFSGLPLAQLAFGVLGVLAMTSEYTSGSIISTLTAVPRRRLGFLAKATVVAGTVLVSGEALAFLAYTLGQAMLASHHLDVGLDAPGVLRAVSSAGLYLFVIAMVGFGLGALLRHQAAAIAALFALVFLAYGVGRALEGWSYLPSRLVLSNVGDVVGQVHATAAKPRLPSLRLAYATLAMYLTLAVGLGTWRAGRDV